jgi:NAD(P)-dependent dehydrogenase (short-subunit alcohol dehydrogenase family)
VSGDWLGLAGKRVAVTGAGGGLGREIALAFTRAGSRVALLDRTEAASAETARLVAAAGGTPATIVCDVANPDSVEAAASEVAHRLGGCDVLVNNAALLRPGPLDTLALAEWNQLIAVNLTGYFLAAQAFGGLMRKAGGGAMVHVASISGTNPQPLSGAYSVSKAGIIMLSRQIAMEWGPVGIRSNVISPGMVETPMSKGFYDTPGVREKRESVIPARRIGQPPDMADAALFLASPRSAYITGEDILIDGGYSKMLMALIPRPGFDKP